MGVQEPTLAEAVGKGSLPAWTPTQQLAPLQPGLSLCLVEGVGFTAGDQDVSAFIQNSSSILSEHWTHDGSAN